MLCNEFEDRLTDYLDGALDVEALAASLHGHREAGETALEPDLVGNDAAASIPVLYGGSVNAGNAKALLAAEGVNGLLVGGAFYGGYLGLVLARVGGAI